MPRKKAEPSSAPAAKAGAKKTKGQQLADQLLNKKQHLADQNPDSAMKAGDAYLKKAADYCEGYKTFLDDGKTEREAVKAAEALLKKAGYKLWNSNAKLKAGDKIYTINRGKAILAATIGTKPLAEGVRMSIAHVDAPRLDLKPNPLYESEQLAYFKTHYYGGIRKYQWVAIPLAMHGVMVKADGEAVDIHIGEQPGDPVFTITDLLPHLAADQNKRSLPEGIKGEELNIVVGSLPFAEAELPDRVKLETLRLLNEKYGVTERDFVRAEIEFVPAFKAADIGFDRGLVGAYGQDDRVSAYTILTAEIDTQKPQRTTLCVLCDKEETGSDGNTGLAGDYLVHFLEDLADTQGVPVRRLLAASMCLSADVNGAFDPTFASAFEKNNSVQLNHGLAVTKYHGARGKSSTSDASAEYMGYVTNLLDAKNIPWQSGELGKVDQGGGTIAKFVANHNVDVVDVGVPLLSMHAPFELAAKLDIYAAHQAFCAFNEAP